MITNAMMFDCLMEAELTIISLLIQIFEIIIVSRVITKTNSGKSERVADSL